MLLKFDTFGRSPLDRIGMLESAGCDPKFLAKGTKISIQREALERQLCKGKVASVEEIIIRRLLQRAFGDRDIGRFGIMPCPFGFVASFRKETETMEKTFPKVCRAIQWCNMLSVADKDRRLLLIFKYSMR